MLRCTPYSNRSSLQPNKQFRIIISQSSHGSSSNRPHTSLPTLGRGTRPQSFLWPPNPTWLTSASSHPNAGGRRHEAEPIDPAGTCARRSPMHHYVRVLSRLKHVGWVFFMSMNESFDLAILLHMCRHSSECWRPSRFSDVPLFTWPHLGVDQGGPRVIVALAHRGIVVQVDLAHEQEFLILVLHHQLAVQRLASLRVVRLSVPLVLLILSPTLHRIDVPPPPSVPRLQLPRIGPAPKQSSSTKARLLVSSRLEIVSSLVSL